MKNGSYLICDKMGGWVGYITLWELIQEKFMQMSGCKPRSPGSTMPIIDSEKGNSIPVETEVVHQVDLHTVKFIFLHVPVIYMYEYA